MQTSQNSTRYCVIVCVYVGSTCGSVFAGVFYISHMMKNFKILMDLDFAKNSNKTNWCDKYTVEWLKIGPSKEVLLEPLFPYFK